MATSGNIALLYATVKKLVALFKACRESVDDDSRSGRPTSVVTNEGVQDVEKFVMKDRRVSIRHIDSEMTISVGSVKIILHNRLNWFKASAGWDSCLLTPVQKINFKISCASRFCKRS